jgi:uncharacterized protein YxjI
MERFEFPVTQWEKEGGYVQVDIVDNRTGAHLGCIRQPLFRMTSALTEGWYFLDWARNNSAAVYLRMSIHPYLFPPSLGTAVGAPTAAPEGAGRSFVLRKHFWKHLETYEIRDPQGMLQYTLHGKFKDPQTGIRIVDATGNEVGSIREETSFLKRLYQLPPIIISTYGTSATLKRKMIAWTGQPTYVVRSASTKKGAPLLQTKGKTLKYEYEFKQGKAVVAEVSNKLAPGDNKMYGVKVAPTFPNPLLVLAAAIATDRSLSVAAKRPAPTFDSPGIDTSFMDFSSSASAGGGGD